MQKLTKGQLPLIEPMFSGIEDSMVIACMQGYMGDAYVKGLENPEAAFIISG
jgi:hypothetical protein